MRLPSYPNSFDTFIQDTVKTAKDNGIKIRLSAKKVVYADEHDKIGSSGYFSSEIPELAIATKRKNPNDWLLLMIHESCHMDQFLENKVAWDRTMYSYQHFFDWIDGNNDLQEHEIQTAIDDVIATELDCERRSVEKIKRYGLPVDIEMYKKKANSYLYAIRFFGNCRRWLNDIYSDNDVWTIAPVNFKKKYDKIPSKLLRAYEIYAETH